MRTDLPRRFDPGVFLVLFIGVFFQILLPCCDNDPAVIGADILPETDDFSVFFDSTEVIELSTRSGDSVRSGDKSIQLLGSYTESFFGFSRAEIVTQIEAPGYAPESRIDHVVDSAVLTLYSSSFFGRKDALHRISVHEFTGELFRDSVYYSNFDVQGKFLPGIIGSGTVHTSDSLVRISFGDLDFMERILIAEDTVFEDTDMLNELFRGFYITSEAHSNGGSILYTDLSDEQSLLIVYYKNNRDTLSYTFSLGRGPGIAVNVFSHEYSGFPVEPYLEDGSGNDSLVFIQAMGGLRSVLKFPELDNWRDSVGASGKIAINNAELIFVPEKDPRSSITEDQYPAGLNLYWFNEDNRLLFIYDYLINEESFGGEYIRDENQYRFNIKTHIQSYLNGDISRNPLLLVTPMNASNTLNYLILRGGNHSSGSRVKLKMTYTKL